MGALKAQWRENSEHFWLTGQINSATLKLYWTPSAFLSAQHGFPDALGRNGMQFEKFLPRMQKHIPNSKLLQQLTNWAAELKSFLTQSDPRTPSDADSCDITWLAIIRFYAVPSEATKRLCAVVHPKIYKQPMRSQYIRGFCHEIWEGWSALKLSDS